MGLEVRRGQGANGAVRATDPGCPTTGCILSNQDGYVGYAGGTEDSAVARYF